jgi:hypothetical protein
MYYLLHMRDARPSRLSDKRSDCVPVEIRFLSFLEGIPPLNESKGSVNRVRICSSPLTRGVFFIYLYAASGPRFFILY